MKQLTELVFSTLSLYDNKFFISDENLSEDIIKDMQNLNVEFNNKFKSLYINIITTNESIIRKSLVKLKSLKDKYKYSSAKEFEVNLIEFNPIAFKEYFSISNYIEKVNIVDYMNDKSFIDTIVEDLKKSLIDYEDEIVNRYFQEKEEIASILSNENKVVYNSAIIENFNNVEKVLVETSKVLNIINDKIKTYGFLIDEMNKYDIGIIRKISSKTKYCNGESNKDFAIIGSRSILTQKVYTSVIYKLYLHFAQEINMFLSYIEKYIYKF